MADNIEPEEGTVEDHPDIVRQRTRIKELEDEVKMLRQANLKHAFAEAGFDPAKGHGKLLYENYKGEREAEAIRRWAQDEYGITASAGQEEVSKPPARSEAEQTQVAFAAKLDRARQESTPPDRDRIAQALADARKAGDVQAEIALQLAQWESGKS